MKTELAGAQFVANERLSNLADETLADVGDTCERVPASSLPWLLAQGRIRPADPMPARPPAGKGA
jgi:hypothetical protein